MSILEAFWYGNIHPCEQYLQKDSAYFKALRKSELEKQQLLASFSPELRNTVEKLLDTQTEPAILAERDAFLMGFRLSVQIMCDSLCHSPESRT